MNQKSGKVTYQIQFRKKILKCKSEGVSYRKLYKRFGISPTTIRRWEKQLEPKKTKNTPWKKLSKEALKKDVERYPDSYHYERAARLGVSKTRIFNALKSLDVTYKKTLNHPKADPEKRSTFCRKVEKLEKECRSIVYIDESGFAHDMPRTHGYSVKGKRCYDKHDWGAKGRTNAIGALIGSTLVAVGLLTGSVNTDVFTTWVDKILLPNIPEKSVIVMDNASFHKGADMQKILEDAGHTLLYLPPYSPDLNPIEKKWAQIKKARRSSGDSIDNIFKSFLL